MMFSKRFAPFLSPQRLYQFCARIQSWLLVAAVMGMGLGLLAGLFWAPADYQQGDAFRMIYLHVPSAFLSLLVYSVMTAAAVLAIIFRIKVAEYVVQVSPVIGAGFTLIALVTGSLWGKPMWGTWWIWDARLTSELILLFLYLGIMALGNAIPNPQKAARAMCLLTLVGFIDIPIIHYSVYWWQTLHQGATLTVLSQPKIAGSMLWPLLLVIVGFIAYYGWLLCLHLRAKIISMHRQSSWLQTQVAEG